MNEVLSWYEINLMVSFHDITQNMFCNLANISHPTDLEIYYFNFELVILSYIDATLSVYCSILY